MASENVEARLALIVTGMESVIAAAKNVKELNINLKDAESGSKGMGSALKGATPAMIGLGAEAALLGVALTVTVQAMGELIEAAKKSIGAFAQFEHSMTKIETLTAASKESVDEWRTTLLTLSDTGQGPQELANAMYFVASSGQEASKTLELTRLAAEAASVGLGDAATIGMTLTSVTNAYSKEGLTAGHTMDLIAVAAREAGVDVSQFAGNIGTVAGIAANFGVSLEEVLASLATYTRAVPNASMAVTGLKQTIVNLMAPSKQTVEVLNELGMSAEQVRVSIRERGLMTTLQDLIKAADGNVEVLNDLVPNVRALAAVMVTAGSQGEGYAATLEKMKNADGEWAKVLERNRENLAFQEKQIRASAAALEVMFGAMLANQPIFRELVGALKDLASASVEAGVGAEAWLNWLARAIPILGPLIQGLDALALALSKVRGDGKKGEEKSLSLPWEEAQKAVEDYKNTIKDINFGDVVSGVSGLDAALKSVSGDITSMNVRGPLAKGAPIPSDKEAHKLSFAKKEMIQIEKDLAKARADNASALQEEVDKIIANRDASIEEAKVKAQTAEELKALTAGYNEVAEAQIKAAQDENLREFQRDTMKEAVKLQKEWTKEVTEEANERSTNEMQAATEALEAEYQARVDFNAKTMEMQERLNIEMAKLRAQEREETRQQWEELAGMLVEIGSEIGGAFGMAAEGGGLFIGVLQALSRYADPAIKKLTGLQKVTVGLGAAMDAYKSGSVLKGAGTGALAGASIAGPIGAIIGGLAGGILGLFGKKKKKAEELKKKQEAAMNAFSELFDQWKAAREELAQTGLEGLNKVLDYYIQRIGDGGKLAGEELSRVGGYLAGTFAMLRASGMSTVEALGVMREKINALQEKGVDLSGTAAAPLAALAAAAKEHEARLQFIAGLGEMASAMAGFGLLTQEMANSISADMGGAIQAIIDSGVSYEQALALTAQDLYNLQQAAEQSGVTLDEHTQKMIDDAEAAGLFENLEDPMKKLVELNGAMVAAMGELVKLMGGTLPAAIQKLVDEFNRAQVKPPSAQPSGPALPQAQHGGVAGFTGPVMVHGTPAMPEIILNPYQSKDWLRGKNTGVTGGRSMTIMVDARGATNPAAVEAAARRGVRMALERGTDPQLKTALREAVRVR